MMLKNILLLATCLACSSLLSATTTSDSVTVRFRQSHISLDPAFAGNGERLDSIFARMLPDSTHRAAALRHITVIGAASPEGSVAFNRYLSEKRARAIVSEFRSRGLVDDSTDISHSFLGRDWRGLRSKVERDSDVPCRSEVLGLLDRIVDGDESISHPLARLKAIGGGQPYIYMYHTLFPGLRKSQLIFEYDFAPAVAPFRLMPGICGIALPALPEAIEETELIEQVHVCRPFYMGLKTNMLYDLMLIPNIGADIYIGKGWSLTADWMYGWWDRDRTHYYWRAYGGTLGARRWFGRRAAEKPLTGHHLGVYAGAVTYDFELGGTGYMGGKPHGTLWERCNFIGGIEYGYSLPVARRLNIDFTIGIGYLGGKYYKYIPKDGFYMWQSTHRLHWFGPTKAEISLVWLIGCDNYNRTKGGRK